MWRLFAPLCNVDFASCVAVKLLLCSAGFRIGKGEGFADMEYGMMASMGAVSDSTVVVTIVHDCQARSFPYCSSKTLQHL